MFANFYFLESKNAFICVQFLFTSIVQDVLQEHQSKIIMSLSAFAFFGGLLYLMISPTEVIYNVSNLNYAQ